jgi:hypothetical protein
VIVSGAHESTRRSIAIPEFPATPTTVSWAGQLAFHVVSPEPMTPSVASVVPGRDRDAAAHSRRANR